MADKKNVSKSLERVVAETAMLAGETMLIAGAEISRVEDTMNRILDYSKCDCICSGNRYYLDFGQ